MSTKEKDAPAATVASKDECSTENKSACSLSELPDIVNECLNLRGYIDSTGSMSKDVAKVVKDVFPSFSRQLLTQCQAPEKYGIIIHPTGLAVIKAAYGLAPISCTNPEETPGQVQEEEKSKPKRKQRRSLPRAITLRMTTKDYQKLTRKVKEDGFTSVQAWLYTRVSQLLGEQEEK